MGDFQDTQPEPRRAMPNSDEWAELAILAICVGVIVALWFDLFQLNQ